MPRSAGPAPAFDARWLAEALRQREQAHGPLDDAAAAARAREAGGDAEARILCRARLLAEREGLAAALPRWKRRSAWLLAGLLLLAAGGGFSGALAVLGDGSRTVNVVWALLGLLGLPSLMLLLWLASLALGGGDAPAMLGRAWLWLGSRLGGPQAAWLGSGLVSLLARGRLPGWSLGAVSHALWAAALLGALLGLLLALSARRYGFAWETTLLPAAPFVILVDALGWLPARLGFALPDAELVRASANVPVGDHASGRLWASWLLGCLVVYGLLPRLLLGLLCLARFRVGRRDLRLDLAHPYYRALAARLAPANERIGITDADTGSTGAPRLAAPRDLPGDARVLVGIELRPGIDWPPPLPLPGLLPLRIDSREQRHAALERLAAAPPPRLLAACDPRLSPDRGSLALLAELSRHAGRTGVWLLQPERADPERLEHWRQALAALGLAEDDRIQSEAAATAWLLKRGVSAEA